MMINSIRHEAMEFEKNPELQRENGNVVQVMVDIGLMFDCLLYESL